MTPQVIERGRLGVLTKIGQGGQGVVFGAPNVTTKFAASMVYKEYKAATLAAIDFGALAAMPALVEESLSYADGGRLVSIAAWPCAIVEDGSASTGFVMPAIPQEFFISLTTVKGASSSTAEFQHLLNHSSVLAARGIEIDDAQRYSLLREVASGLAFLHKHGVCVGDISPKNLAQYRKKTAAPAVAALAAPEIPGRALAAQCGFCTASTYLGATTIDTADMGATGEHAGLVDGRDMGCRCHGGGRDRRGGDCHCGGARQTQHRHNVKRTPDVIHRAIQSCRSILHAPTDTGTRGDRSTFPSGERCDTGAGPVCPGVGWNAGECRDRRHRPRSFPLHDGLRELFDG